MAVSSTFTAGSGEGYDRIMGRWSARLAEPFLDFSGCNDGEDILDAGCGTGSLTSALSRRINARSITGVDFSPIYIDYASRIIRDPRITFKVGDICALPFADHSFDRVLSLLVLHFVPQTERAVVELRRVARPGATVSAAVWDVRGGYVANRMFYDTAAAFDDEGRKRRRTTIPGRRRGPANSQPPGTPPVSPTFVIRRSTSAWSSARSTISGYRLPARTVRVPNILRQCPRDGGIACAIWSATRISTASLTAHGPMLR
jgi:SAM-dependent methyltransferase